MTKKAINCPKILYTFFKIFFKYFLAFKDSLSGMRFTKLFGEETIKRTADHKKSFQEFKKASLIRFKKNDLQQKK